MPPLKKAETAALLSIVRSDAWAYVERIIVDRIRAIKEEEIGDVDSFNTLRHLHRNEGAAKALAAVLDEIERAASYE